MLFTFSSIHLIFSQKNYNKKIVQNHDHEIYCQWKDAWREC